LHRRYGVVRGRLGPVDLELRRFQRRHHRELLCSGNCSRRRIYTPSRRRIYTANRRRIDTDANANTGSYQQHLGWGDNFGEPGQRNVRQNLDRDLVRAQRNRMPRLGRVERGEGDQRHLRGIADKHYDLHADLHREGRCVKSQCDGSGECRPDAGKWRVRIGERRDGIVCTFDQPLLHRYGIVRGRRGPVDLELRRF
jgi:hypothetical protein